MGDDREMDWEEIRGEIIWDKYPITPDRHMLNLGYGYYAYPVYSIDLTGLGCQVIETATCFVAHNQELTIETPKFLGYLLVSSQNGKLEIVYPKALPLPGVKLLVMDLIGGKR